MTKLSLFTGLISLLLLMACSGAPEGEKVKAGAEKEVKENATVTSNYDVDTQNSYINWEGSKPTGKHKGKLPAIMGTLSTDGSGNITMGKFMADISSIEVTDLKAGEGKEKLEGHLKSADFFDVETDPMATFQVTGTEPMEADGVTHTVTGNLKIKGITKSISFPAMIKVTDNSIMAKSQSFTINRTEWDLKYGSGAIGTVQDKLIHDEIGLTIFLVGSKRG